MLHAQNPHLGRIRASCRVQSTHQMPAVCVCVCVCVCAHARACSCVYGSTRDVLCVYVWPWGVATEDVHAVPGWGIAVHALPPAATERGLTQSCAGLSSVTWKHMLMSADKLELHQPRMRVVRLGGHAWGVPVHALLPAATKTTNRCATEIHMAYMCGCALMWLCGVRVVLCVWRHA